METAGYTALARQSGLVKEMRIVANNIANAATTGYRQEGLIFSEFLHNGQEQGGLSMSGARVPNTSMIQGQLTETGGTFDLAIEGEGFFLIETPDGERLTRAGNFAPNAAGDLVTLDGHRVLDAGGAPVFVPAGLADVSIAPDGTISADGNAIGQIGLYLPTDPTLMVREDGVKFRSDGGVEPAPDAQMLQRYLEGSNVNAIDQMARMIEVQRAYEMGQSFLRTEDERIRKAVETLIKT